MNKIDFKSNERLVSKKYRTRKKNHLKRLEISLRISIAIIVFQLIILALGVIIK